MSFGVSVGDFFAVGKLCWNVYTMCKDSPGNYKQLSGEVSSLYAVTRETELLLSKQDLSPGQQARLATCRQGCAAVLKDLDGLLVKYKGLGTKSQRTFDRLAFGSHDIDEIRLRLISNVSMLDAFNNASSHEKLEKKLEMLISEVRAGKREGSIVSTRSFGTAAENNKEIWDALRRELEDIGISSEIISEKQHFIVAWFQEAVAAGRLEEEAPSDEDVDSIAHCGSRSSKGSSDSNSVINQERPSHEIEREISKRSSSDLNNLDLSQLTIETNPAAESLWKPPNPPKPPKPPKVEKKSRLSVFYLLSKLRSHEAQLLEAATGGYLERVRSLLDYGADIEARYKEGVTALIIAAMHGHSQIVQLLLDSGANVNAKTVSGRTALCVAAKRHDTIDIVRILLDNYANITVANTIYHPLIVASNYESTAVLQLLIDRGANTEVRGVLGRTALHQAAYSGRKRSVKLLIQNGAAIEARDSTGDTVLIAAVWSKSSINLVRLLLEKGANTEAIGEHCYTPLHVATIWDRADIARLLLEYGAKTDSQDERGQTPLRMAERYDKKAVIPVLRAAEEQRLNQLRNTSSN